MDQGSDFHKAASMLQEELTEGITLHKNVKTSSECAYTLTCRKSINYLKHQDVLSLLSYITPVYDCLYNSLKPTKKAQRMKPSKNAQKDN